MLSGDGQTGSLGPINLLLTFDNNVRGRSRWFQDRQQIF